MPDYSTLITAAGQAAFANAIAIQTPVIITVMAVGDSNGVGYDPDENQIALVNEVYESNAIDVTVEAGGIIAVEMTIPVDQGGWHVREAAVKADDGTVLAIMRYPDSYKPLPSSSIASTKSITMKLDVGNTNAVTWQIDPASKANIGGQLRPDFRSVESIEDNPPGNAILGQTWIVGLAPTGAWVGHENELAEWTGTAWAFAEPTPWMLVGLADRTDWRWDHTLVAPAWVEIRSATVKDAAGAASYGIGGGTGNSQTATTPPGYRSPNALFDGMLCMWNPVAPNDGAATLDAFGLGAKPLTLASGSGLAGGELRPGVFVMAVYAADGGNGNGAWLLMPWATDREVPALITTHSRNAITNADVPLNAHTVTHNGLGDSTFAGGVLTCGAEDAGIWYITPSIGVSSAGASIRLQAEVNGSNVINRMAGGHSTFGSAVGGSNLILLNEGDQLQLFAHQRTGATATVLGNFAAIRQPIRL